MNRVGPAVFLSLLMLMMGQTMLFQNPYPEPSMLEEPTEIRSSGTVFTGNGTQWQPPGVANTTLAPVGGSWNGMFSGGGGGVGGGAIHPISDDMAIFRTGSDTPSGIGCFSTYSHINYSTWHIHGDSYYNSSLCYDGSDVTYGPTIGSITYLGFEVRNIPGLSNNAAQLFAYNRTNDTMYFVAEINAALGADEFHMVAINSTIYMGSVRGPDSVDGEEFWAYETTNDTLWQVADLNPGSPSSSPISLLPVGSSLLFAANGGGGSQLWVHETTNGSTWRASDTNPQVSSINPVSGLMSSKSSAVLDTRLMFYGNDGTNADHELWAYDTSNHTVWQSANINERASETSYCGYHFTRDGTRMYFCADNGTSGDELWAYESTNDSVWLLADLYPVTVGGGSIGLSSSPRRIAAMDDGQLVFDAVTGNQSGSYGRDIYVYNFTNNTAWIPADFNGDSPGYGHTRIMAVTGSQILILAEEKGFINETSDEGLSLFVYETSNDTIWWAGRLGLTENKSKAQLDLGSGILNFGTEVLFTLSCHASPTWQYSIYNCPNNVSSPTDLQLWVYTPANVIIPDGFTPVGGHDLTPPTGGFEAVWGGGGNDGNGGGSGGGSRISPASTTVVLTNNTAMTPIIHNWIGGSAGDTTTYNGNETSWAVADINGGGGYDSIRSPIVVGTRCYFSADGTNGEELWAYETTNNSAWMVADINNGTGSSSPRELLVVGTRIFFSANDGTVNGLWAHEMTNDSTWMVADIKNGSNSNPSPSAAIGTRLFFSAHDGIHGVELWAHEMTNDTTWMVADIYNGSSSSYGGSDGIVVGSRYYFNANEGNTSGSHGDLWVYEMTNETIWNLTDSASGGPVSPSQFISMGSRIYFRGSTGFYANIWAHETTNDTTWKVTDADTDGLWPASGMGMNQPNSITKVDSKILFVISGSGGVSIWIHDTTNDTTWNSGLIDLDWNDWNYPFAHIGSRIFFRIDNGSGTSNRLGAFEISNETSWVVDGGSLHGPSYIRVIGAQLIFQGYFDGGSALWMHDPIGVTVSGPNNGPVTNATCEISPTLPAGLVLDQGTCTISGTPTVTQSSTAYTLWVNDSGISDTATIDITIESGDPIILPASTTVTLTNNTAMNPITYNWTGGLGDGAGVPNDGPVTNATCEISPTLPAGIDLTQGNCTIGGTPTVVQNGTTYTLWVNDSGVSDSTEINITIEELVLNLPAISPSAASAELIRTVAMTPITFSNTGGAIDTWGVDPELPDGLAIASDGTISGTPTTVQEATNYTVWANNSDGTNTSILTITVDEYIPDPPKIGYDESALNLTQFIQMTTMNPSNSGGNISSWEIVPELTPGLVFNNTTGSISGIPTTNESAITYTIWANNTGGNNSTTLEITIQEPPPGLLISTNSLLLIRDLQMTPIFLLYSGGAIATWEFTPLLPSGLTFDAENNSIIGIPTEAMNETNYTIYANGTGISEIANVTIEILEDTDGDGLPDDLGEHNESGFEEDLDDDGDGISDIDEGATTPETASLLPDTDADGVCDGSVNVTIRGVDICTGGPDAFPTDPSAWNDTDGDGQPDELHGNSTTNLTADEDDDGDGLPDENESILGSLTDPKSPDTDGDGVCDGAINVTINQVLICTAGPDAFPDDPAAWNDTDNDGKPDELHGNSTTGLTEDPDDDGDGAPDNVEIENGTDPKDPLDFPTDDFDADGWTDAQEDFCGTDKNDSRSFPVDFDGDKWCDADDPDDDGDTWSDFDEGRCGSNPLDNSSVPDNLDGDQWCDAVDVDDDQDGWSDADEVDCNTDPMDANSIPLDDDSDGICNYLEEPELPENPFWWLCFLLPLLVVLVFPLIAYITRRRNTSNPEPQFTAAKPDFIGGVGTKDDPFVLSTAEDTTPGGEAESKEKITVTNLTPGTIVEVIDLNEESNQERFRMDDLPVPIDESEDGTIAFHLQFSDEAIKNIRDASEEGDEYIGLIKMGKDSVYFSWPVNIGAALEEAEDTPEEDDSDDDDSEDDEQEPEEESEEEDDPEPEEEDDPEPEEEKLSKEEEKNEQLARIAAKSKSIDFATIGTSSIEEKNDLQKIKGVGPFIEEKLNALGIYNYAQVASMTPEIVDQVNEAIEFFSGRIKRDKWVDQAAELMNEEE